MFTCVTRRHVLHNSQFLLRFNPVNRTFSIETRSFSIPEFIINTFLTKWSLSYIANKKRKISFLTISSNFRPIARKERKDTWHKGRANREKRFEIFEFDSVGSDERKGMKRFRWRKFNKVKEKTLDWSLSNLRAWICKVSW